MEQVSNYYESLKESSLKTMESSRSDINDWFAENWEKTISVEEILSYYDSLKYNTFKLIDISQTALNDVNDGMKQTWEQRNEYFEKIKDCISNYYDSMKERTLLAIDTSQSLLDDVKDW